MQNTITSPVSNRYLKKSGREKQIENVYLRNRARSNYITGSRDRPLSSTMNQRLNQLNIFYNSNKNSNKQSQYHDEQNYVPNLRYSASRKEQDRSVQASQAQYLSDHKYDSEPEKISLQHQNFLDFGKPFPTTVTSDKNWLKKQMQAKQKWQMEQEISQKYDSLYQKDREIMETQMEEFQQGFDEREKEYLSKISQLEFLNQQNDKDIKKLQQEVQQVRQWYEKEAEDKQQERSNMQQLINNMEKFQKDYQGQKEIEKENLIQQKDRETINKLEDKDKIIQQLEDSFKKIQNQHKELDDKKKEADQNVFDLQKEIQDIKSQNEQNQKMQQLQNEAQILQQKQEYEKQFNQQSLQNQEKHQKLEFEVLTTKEKTNLEVKMMENKITELQAQNDQIQSNYKNRITETEELIKKRDEQQIQLIQLQSQVEQHKNRITSIEEQKTDVEKKLSLKNAEMKTQQEEFQIKLKETVQQHLKEVEQINKENQILKDHLKHIQGQNSELQSRQTQLLQSQIELNQLSPKKSMEESSPKFGTSLRKSGHSKNANEYGNRLQQNIYLGEVYFKESFREKDDFDQIYNKIKGILTKLYKSIQDILNQELCQSPKILSQVQLSRLFNLLYQPIVSQRAIKYIFNYTIKCSVSQLVKWTNRWNDPKEKCEVLKTIFPKVQSHYEPNINEAVEDTLSNNKPELNKKLIADLESVKRWNPIFPTINADSVNLFYIDIGFDLDSDWENKAGQMIKKSEYIKLAVQQLIQQQITRSASFNVAYGDNELWQDSPVKGTTENRQQFLSWLQKGSMTLLKNDMLNLINIIKDTKCPYTHIYIITDGIESPDGISDQIVQIRKQQKELGKIPVQCHTTTFQLGLKQLTYQQDNAKQVMFNISKFTKGNYRVVTSPGQDDLNNTQLMSVSEHLGASQKLNPDNQPEQQPLIDSQSIRNSPNQRRHVVINDQIQEQQQLSQQSVIQKPEVIELNKLQESKSEDDSQLALQEHYQPNKIEEQEKIDQINGEKPDLDDDLDDDQDDDQNLQKQSYLQKIDQN